ncbi:alpha-amylase family glycosyl hydrolase [Streptomyces xiamenensis]|uniref:alpha-amylase family glycosyl hydrolase n=1 Tax=Streptomyces xiamenensis TaxID=408015 RepID=UPI0034284731
MTQVPRTPTATYRLQLEPGAGFDAAARLLPYVASLGVSHLHLSPVLEAVPGSRHGYDVTDHTRVRAELGGEAGLRGLAEKARARGLGIIADIVPNHMAFPADTRLNAPLWQLLRDGPASPAAAWFDIDWAAGGGRLPLPVLGAPLREQWDALRVEGGTLRHGDHHCFPLRPGTESLPLPALLDAQHYRLGWWRTGLAQLTYRRFFTVSDLIAVRVEDPAVFEATHATVLRLVAEGVIGGLRVDHPDGLADPEGYLRRLRQRAGPDVWVVAEKILATGEHLPSGWPVAGTTGYDALRHVDAVLTDPVGADRLTADHRRFTAAPADLGGVWEPTVRRAAREILAEELCAERDRLLRTAHRLCGDLHTPEALLSALTELLVHLPVYRPYLAADRPPSHQDTTLLARTADLARRAVTTAAQTRAVDALHALLRGPDTAAADPARSPGRTAPGAPFDPVGPADPAGRSAEGPARTAGTTGDPALRDRDDAGLRTADATGGGTPAGEGAGPPPEPDTTAPARATGRVTPDEGRSDAEPAVRARTAAPDATSPATADTGCHLLAGGTADTGPGACACAASDAQDFRARFGQVSSALRAKAVEDCAGYRFTPLLSAAEVGGDPGEPALPVSAFHAHCARIQHAWPLTGTVYATHDTKRSGDVRAALATLTEHPLGWAELLTEVTERAAHAGVSAPDPHLAWSCWQTAFALAPDPDPSRLLDATLKAAREAALRTTWTDPDADYEAAAERFVRGGPCGAPGYAVARFAEELAPQIRANVLGAALLHLTMPGVPDLYRGGESVYRALVDPDNRRPPRLPERPLSGAADPGSATAPGADAGLPAEKLWLTAVALRLRRAHPEWFGAHAGYEPLTAEGPTGDHALAFTRSGQVLTAVSRLTRTLEAAGGWDSTVLPLPPGRWDDALAGRDTGRTARRPAFQGKARLAEMFADRPVALLVRRDGF